MQKITPVLKADNLDGIEEGSAGYIHNSVISSAVTNDENLFSKSNNEIMKIVLDEWGKTDRFKDDRQSKGEYHIFYKYHR